MCVVSMVSDTFQRRWTSEPDFLKAFERSRDGSASAAEVAELRKEVEILKTLLIEALKYDRRTNQPECEDAQKVAFLLTVGDALGIDLRGALKGE